MKWKLMGGVALVLLIVFSVVMGRDLLGGKDEWDRISSDHSFNIVRWEFENIFDKWGYWAEQVFYPDKLSDLERAQLVEDYLAMNREISSLEARINREKAEAIEAVADVAVEEARLADLKKERDWLEDQVEEIVEGQISGVLADEGLSMTLRLGGEVDLLFPPLDFEFEERPNLLIISTRHKIETVDTVLLRPDMSLEEVLEIEGKVEGLEFSALVETTGGVATYPSIVPQTGSVQDLLSKVAHEWLHHYFFFRPLGWNYWASYEMTTVNETAAGMAGDEVGLTAYRRYYEGMGEDVSPSTGGGEPAFDFGKEMREIRLAVDQYLAEGEIEEAESYMEEKRLFLAANGYYIRKLNQAYFAFHGTYADTPTSVSPIGEQLKKIRERSYSTGDFIRTVSGVSTYGKLLEIVGE